MKRMTSGYRFMIVIAALFLIGALNVTAVEAQTRRISIGTADTGGVYYILGGGIAKVISANVPNTHATAEVTPGAVDNVKMLQNDSVDFAFTKSDIAAEGSGDRPVCRDRKGSGPGHRGALSRHRPCGGFPGDQQTRGHEGEAHLHERPGKRPRDGGRETPRGGGGGSPERFQTRAGQPERIGQCLQGPQDRRILLCHRAPGGLDARHQCHAGAGLPDHRRSVLPAGHNEKTRPHLQRSTDSQGTYSKIDRDVKTIGVPVIFATTEKMDEKLVYAITRTCLRSMPTWSPCTSRQGTSR